jgi:hypothetical protein
MTKRLLTWYFERTTLALVLFLAPLSVTAQSGYTPIAPLRVGETLLNIPTASVLPPGVWELKFTHRFSEPINRGDVHSLWGLDSASDVVIGLAWTPVHDLQLSLLRSNVQDDMEGAVKYVLLRQAPAVPLSVTARGGVDWRTERNLKNRVSGFGQVVLARQFAGRGEIFVVPTLATNAGSLEHAFNVPIGVAWMIRRNVSLSAELIPENRDLPSGSRGDIGWSLGLKKAIGGHYFEILLADSRASLVDQYMAGNFLGSVRAGDIHLGFNLERRFGSPH